MDFNKEGERGWSTVFWFRIGTICGLVNTTGNIRCRQFPDYL
jgi:hypothetical protein